MTIYSVGNASVNLYLLDSGTYRLLIDTGYPGQLSILGHEMRKTGFKITDIDYLMVTHFHVDHAGAIQELKNQGVNFILPDIQEASIEPMQRMMMSKWPYTPLNRSDNQSLTLEESRTFLKQLNISGQLVSTPDHTDDSITLLLDTGEAFTGDLMREDLLMDDSSPEKKSWMTVRNLGAGFIYPGHGAPYAI